MIAGRGAIAALVAARAPGIVLEAAPTLVAPGLRVGPSKIIKVDLFCINVYNPFLFVEIALAAARHRAIRAVHDQHHVIRIALDLRVGQSEYNINVIENKHDGLKLLFFRSKSVSRRSVSDRSQSRDRSRDRSRSRDHSRDRSHSPSRSRSR